MTEPTLSQFLISPRDQPRLMDIGDARAYPLRHALEATARQYRRLQRELRRKARLHLLGRGGVPVL
jgi:hypothetical protein